MTASIPEINVLLIEDDEDEHIIIRDYFSDVVHSTYKLEWLADFDAGLEAIFTGKYDVCLLDYGLGKRNGLEFIREAGLKDCSTPIIFLTATDNPEIDFQAMKEGASDYLVKGQISPSLLQRSIRYAIERNQRERELRNYQNQLESMVAELRELSSRLLSAQEDERRKIAGDIHDTIGSGLVGIKFQVEKVLQMIGKDAGQVAQSLRDTRGLIQDGIEECRRIQMDLRPAMLDDIGLLSTLSWFCRRYETIYSSIRILQEIEIQEDDIPRDLSISIFRTVQEAMTNIAKHSNADLVRLSFKKENGHIELSIQDNGIGFTLEELKARSGRRGLGLSSMKERVELSGGSFSIESEEGRGTLIHALWAAKASRTGTVG